MSYTIFRRCYDHKFVIASLIGYMITDAFLLIGVSTAVIQLCTWLWSRRQWW